MKIPQIALLFAAASLGCGASSAGTACPGTPCDEGERAAFRAASDFESSEVTAENQTALDAAAMPFAVFLTQMHVRIHAHFVDGYLASLGPDPSELADSSQATTLEIGVNPDGSLYRLGILRTSGEPRFDYGAVRSVYRAQPFDAPPDAILSGDGHVWLHWTFHRSARQCGAWNAEPFILRNGPMREP
jgi:hypothetical protein